MARVYPSDWTVRKFQHISTKHKEEKPYELELIEFNFSNADGPILLMVPGYFQNAFVFDLLLEQNISLARYLSTHFNYHMFVLHPNGIGNSDYIKKSNLDDIAIDDIAGAISVLSVSYKKDIYLMGHSNGAISIQCYLGGLTRSESGNRFDANVSKHRQANISGAFLFAGNVCMTDDNPQSSLQKVSRFGLRISFLLKRLGWINALLLTRFISPTKIFGKMSVAYWKLWGFLYHIPNVGRDSRKALYNLTLDGTSAATLLQYSQGVLNNSIRTTAQVEYKEGLKNIEIPISQTTFGLDPLAVPAQTKRDNFSQFGSKDKTFIIIPDQGHEDFMMVAAFHSVVHDSFTIIKTAA